MLYPVSMTSSWKRFERAAPTYDLHNEPQVRTADALLSLLPDLPAGARILEVGCGTGLLTCRLATRYPLAILDALDPAGALIEVASRRPECSGRARWIVSSVESYTPDDCYSLIVSSAALHWIWPLGPVLARMAGWMHSGSILAAAVMVSGTLAELHAARRTAAPDKPPLRDFPSAGDIELGIDRAGLKTEHLETLTFVTGAPSAAVLLRSLREQGVTGGDLSRGQAPLTRQEIRRLIELYDGQYDGAGGVQATYRVALALARCPRSHG